MEEKGAKIEPNGNKRTQIAEIGKDELLRRLFEGTGYCNIPLQKVSSPGISVMGNSQLMLEGVDFDLVYTPLKHLGYKSALLALGPVYANCYNPQSLAYTIGISARFAAEDIVEFWSGVVAAAKEHNVKQLALTLKASMTGLSIAVSSQGSQKNKVLESASCPNTTSLICLTGNVGAAYMGLHVLEREKIMFNRLTKEQAAKYVQPDLSKYKYILSQYLSPEINPKTTSQFVEAKLIPSAGYFVVNGLASTIKQLCNEHNCGARIYLEKIPIAVQTMDMAKEINMDAVTAALNGGDDYKFLFVIPVSEHEKFHKEFPNVDIIGHLCAKDAGAALITPEGSAIEIRSL